jgi:hypothetical protein
VVGLRFLKTLPNTFICNVFFWNVLDNNDDDVFNMSPTPKTPLSSRFFMPSEEDLPTIDTSENFTSIVNKLSEYMIKSIDASYTYEQLRTTFAGQSLKPLIQKLTEDCHHPALIAALLQDFPHLMLDGSNDATVLQDMNSYLKTTMELG